MEKLLIEATEDSPKIEFDNQIGIFHISERSLLENSVAFYNPIIDWLLEYKENPNKETIFEIKLEYFNTSSSKQIAKILLILEDISKTSTVLVKWFYAANDRDIHSSGIRYSKLINIPFEFIQL
jgi:hypothetical protein